MRTTQRRHESPELGDAIVRMMRGLVTRASEGDLEAVEQLARIDQLARPAKAIGLRMAWHHGYSWTQLAAALGVTRQAARQLGVDVFTTPAAWELTDTPEAHQLLPGHDKRSCQLASCRPVSYPAPVAAPQTSGAAAVGSHLWAEQLADAELQARIDHDNSA